MNYLDSNVFVKILLKVDLHWSFVDYECYEIGSVYGYKYNPETESCTCKPGVSGDRCEGKKKVAK